MTRNFTKLILKSPYQTHYFTEDDLDNDYSGYENVCKIWAENNVIKIKHGNDGDFIPTFTFSFLKIILKKNLNLNHTKIQYQMIVKF